MSYHPATWHDRQLEHVRECMAEADKRHTPQELADAMAALSGPVAKRQGGLFNTTTRRHGVREVKQ